MLTTAGSTRFTMPENELAEGMGSGTVSRDASVPLKDFMAETRPEITEPIMIPTMSVNATKNDARILRRRAQLKSSFTCSPMSLLLILSAGITRHANQQYPPASRRFPNKYNTADDGQLLGNIDALGSSLSQSTELPR